MPQRDDKEAMIIEVRVEDAEGLAAAVEGGADRIELCAAPGIGGITPPAGFMRLAARCGVPVSVMIRPRGGDFIFSAAEMDSIQYDIDAVRSAGLSGVVPGVSRPDGRSIPRPSNNSEPMRRGWT